MSKFKNNRLVPGCPPDEDFFEGKTPESARSDQKGGNYLPLGLRTADRFAAGDTESVNRATRDVASEVHDEVMGYFTRPTKMIANNNPIRAGEKFMVTSPNEVLNIPAGTIIKVSHEQKKDSSMVLVFISDERSKPRIILIDRKILLEDTIRLSSLVVN